MAWLLFEGFVVERTSDGGFIAETEEICLGYSERATVEFGPESVADESVVVPGALFDWWLDGDRGRSRIEFRSAA